MRKALRRTLKMIDPDNYMKIKTAAFIYNYAKSHGNLPYRMTFIQWVEKNNIRLYESVIRA